jgi:hypothetical protein
MGFWVSLFSPVDAYPSKIMSRNKTVLNIRRPYYDKPWNSTFSFLICKLLWLNDNNSLLCLISREYHRQWSLKPTAVVYFETHSMFITSMVHFVRAETVLFCLFMQTTSLSCRPGDEIIYYYWIMNENVWEYYLNLFSLWFFFIILFILHAPFYLHNPQYIYIYIYKIGIAL